METTVWEGILAAFGLLIMTSIFWIPALIIGRLWRNRRHERMMGDDMSRRLETARAEQELYQLKREQLLEDEIYEHRKRRMLQERDREIIDMEFEYEDELPPPKSPKRVLAGRDQKRLK